MALNYLVNVYIGKLQSGGDNIDMSSLILIKSDEIVSFHDGADSTTYSTGETNGRILYSDGTMTPLGETLNSNQPEFFSCYKPVIIKNDGVPSSLQTALNMHEISSDDTFYTFLYFKNNKRYVTLDGGSNSYDGNTGQRIYNDTGAFVVDKYFPLRIDKYRSTTYNPADICFPAITLNSNNTATSYSQIRVFTRQGASNVYIYGYVVNQTYFLSGINEVIGGVDPYVPTDPYNGAGDSTTGGGGGTFDPSGDDIPIPSLPTLSASDAGFITLFNPSVAQLNSLASYMWTNAAFDIANFKKIFEDPMDCILGLSIVPIAVTTSGSADVAIGNLLISSIQFPVVASQYQEFNCGTVTIPEFFGGYLDYEPYTKLQIVIPYCGTFQISADDVIGKTLQLVYHIDVLTGSCVAMLLCGTTVLYQFNGSCAVNIPINSINYASTIENATRIAVAIGTTVATAGAAAPAIAAGGEAAGTAGATLFNSAINTAGATAEGALSMKPSIERSGALSSSSGMMSVQTPYIVVTRPRLCKPKDQDKIKGYPSFIETTVGALEGKGYTEFDTVILNNIYLTDSEKGELDRILRGGVFL